MGNLFQVFERKTFGKLCSSSLFFLINSDLTLFVLYRSVNGINMPSKDTESLLFINLYINIDAFNLSISFSIIEGEPMFLKVTS